MSAASTVGAQSITVLPSSAAVAASAEAKTTFADESLIHSTHCGACAPKSSNSSLVLILSTPYTYTASRRGVSDGSARRRFSQ